MQHLDLLGDSFIDLKNNISLVIPDLIMLVMNAFLTLAFLLINGDVFSSLINNPGVLFRQDGGNIVGLLDSVKVQNNLFKLVISFLGFLFVNFLFGAGLVAIKFGMIKEMIKKKKASLIMGFKEGGKNVMKVLQIRVFVFLLISIFTLGLNFALNGFLSFSQSAYILLSLYLFSEISVFLVNLFLLFRYPILFLDNVNGFTAVKKAFGFTFKKYGFVLSVWFIIFLITVLFSYFFSVGLGYIVYMGESLVGLMLVTILFYLLRSLINLVIRLWLDIYLFRCYVKRK